MTFLGNTKVSRRPPPSHRHATPSGPWPFLDITDEVDPLSLSSPPPQPNVHIDHDEHDADEANLVTLKSRHGWSGYPQSLFANWTAFQREKSGIAKLVNRTTPLQERCRIFRVNILSDGTFHDDKPEWVVKTGQEVSDSVDELWDNLQQKLAPEIKVRCMFIESLSGPVLQMLGSKFHIEPFFFSSSLNRIPSRYQEQVQPGKGDHITITLNFVRPLSLSNPPTAPSSSGGSYVGTDDLLSMQTSLMHEQVIDVGGPLSLQSAPDKILTPDLLSIHIIRKKADASDIFIPHHQQHRRSNSTSSSIRGPLRRSSTASSMSGHSAPNANGVVSTIISYHPAASSEYPTTSASTLHHRLLAAGHSVYWSRIFQSTVPTGDPTLVAVSLLWYAMYAWDEVLDALQSEVGWLESQTLSTLPHPDHPDRDPHGSTHTLTHQLHALRAHLLHYQELLNDFRKSVTFIRKTSNPALLDEPTVQPSPPEQRRPSMSKINTDSLTRKQTLHPVPESPADTGSTGNTPTTSETPNVASALKETARILSSVDNPRPAWLLREQREARFLDDDVLFVDMEMEEDLEELEPQERLVKKETRILLNEIERLEKTSRMLDKRLGNVMQLAFSSVNIEDSRRMSKLAEAAGRDSAVMKQISYLTMVFLPSSFIATVFGMNIKEINDGTHGTLPQYLATAIPLTVVTIWIMMVLYNNNKKRSPVTPSSFFQIVPANVWMRAWDVLRWPFCVIIHMVSSFARGKYDEKETGSAHQSGTRSRLASARDSVRTRTSTLRQAVIPSS